MTQSEAEQMLLCALSAQGLPHEKRSDGVHMNLSVRGREIQTLLRLCGDRLTLYAQLLPQGDEARMALICNRINRSLGDGCLVADEQGRVLLKQTVYLTDALYAPQSVERALGRQQTLANRCIGALEKEKL